MGRHALLQKVKDAVSLGRPVNAVMVFLATIIGGLIAGLSLPETIVPALSATFISMGAQAVNDYFDVEIDKKKGRRKPLVDGSLNMKEARIVFLLYFALGILLGLIASWLHFVVAFIVSAISYLYSAKLQAKKYVGNVAVSVLTALTMIYGGLSGRWERNILPALIIFLVNWGREILKDISDGNIDYPRKISLFHVLGRRWSNFFGSYLVFLGVVFTPFPYLMLDLHDSYIPLIALADLVALLALTEALRLKESRAEKTLKVAMALAILAFAVGVVA